MNLNPTISNFKNSELSCYCNLQMQHHKNKNVSSEDYQQVQIIYFGRSIVSGQTFKILIQKD